MCDKPKKNQSSTLSMTAWLSICLLAVVASSANSHGTPKIVNAGIPEDRALGTVCKTTEDCHGIANSQCLEGSQGKLECRCRSGYVIDGSLTRCLKVANGYYDTCEESVQCSEFLGRGGRCKDKLGRCVCTDNYHYLHGRCHESKGLYEACENDDDCFVNADYRAASCQDGVCKCSLGFYQREYSTCRPKAEKVGDACVIDSDCVFDLNAKCDLYKCISGEEKSSSRSIHASAEKKDEPSTPIVNNIIIGKSECKVDTDCKSIKHSICAANSTCVCDRGYFATRRINPTGPDFQDGCVPEIGMVCDAHVENDFNVTDSTCTNNVWTCNIKTAAVKDNRLCREVTDQLGGDCKYQEQCQILGPQSYCNPRGCHCNETTQWVQKEKFCWKKIKICDACVNDYDCYSKGENIHPICQSRVCECPEGSKASKDFGYCIRDHPEPWDYCETDEECETIPNTECTYNSCSCKKYYFFENNQCLAGLHAACEIDDDCKQDNTACLKSSDGSKTCQCSEKFTLPPGKYFCIEKSQYQKECEYDVQCSTAVNNTYCDGITKIKKEKNEIEADYDYNQFGLCQCLVDYYFDKNACYLMKWPGQECNRNADCFATWGKVSCQNGFCLCEKDHTINGRVCVPLNASPGLHLSSWLLFSILVIGILSAIP